MLPIGRKPVVQYIVEELSRCGITRLLFITGPGKTAIENHFDIDAELIDNLRTTGKEELLSELAFERDELEYFYTRQRRQLGLGHAILCSEAVVDGQPFVVALGDSIIGLNAESRIVRLMIEQFETTGAEAIVALEEVPRDEVVHYGIADPHDASSSVFELRDLIEKPSVEEAPSNLAIAARYVFAPSIFEFLHKTQPGRGEEIQLTDAIRMMIQADRKVLGIRLPPNEGRFDIGNFAAYFRAFVDFALADEHDGPRLREHLKSALAED